jgi:hypothetical protein
MELAVDRVRDEASLLSKITQGVFEEVTLKPKSLEGFRNNCLVTLRRHSTSVWLCILEVCNLSVKPTSTPIK